MKEETNLQILLERFERGEVCAEGYEPVTLVTDQGDLATRYYAPKRPSAGASTATAGTWCAVFVGDVAGGFDTPVRGRLYPELCQSLSADGVACLWLRYRRPGDFEQCVLDVLAALAFLDEEDVGPTALIGHSFGAAVAIHAGLLSPVVVTCVALAAMPNGAEEAEYLGPRCSLLLAHGSDDRVVPAEIPRQVFAIASEPKRLLIKEGAGHALDEWDEELAGIVGAWTLQELRRGSAGSQP